MTSIGDLFNHFMTLIGLKYYNKTESDNKYALKSEIPSDLTVDSSLSTNSTNPVQNKVVKGALDGKASSSHTHGNLTNDGNIGSVSGKVVTTTTNGVLTVSNWETEVNNLIEQLIMYGGNNSSISLTVDNPILSYVDSTQQNPQVATLTAQLMDDEEADLSGVSVQFSIVDEQGTVLSIIDSADTDANGVATCTYTSQGVGDILIDASVDNRMFVSKTYEVQDCLLYQDWSKITSTWATNVISDRTSYSLTSNYQVDVEMEWKYKNNIPTTFIGFGVAIPSYDAKGMLYLQGSTQNWYYHQSYVNQLKSISLSPSVSSVFKIQSNNLHTLKLLVDDVLITSQASASSVALNLRIDDFNASPTELEYLKVKPL